MAAAEVGAAAPPRRRGPPAGYMGRCRGVEAFEKLNRLGEGTYGTVYRARDIETGEILALKKVRIHAEKEGFPKSSLREIRLLRRLKHPNIVELREVACGRQPGSVFLVFEYCEHDVGALLDLMERPFTQAEVKCLLLQLLRAVACLHAQFVIHRDLKLSNLLLTNRGAPAAATWHDVGPDIWGVEGPPHGAAAADAPLHAHHRRREQRGLRDVQDLRGGEAVGSAATRAIGAPAAAGSHLEADWERILRKCEAILERNAQPVTICAGPGGFAGPTKVIRALEAQALARSVGFPAEDLDDAGMFLFREVRRRAGGAAGGRAATAGGPPGGGNKTRLSVLERPDGTQLVCLEAGAPTPAERLALSSAGGVGAGSLGGSLAGTGPLRLGSSGGRQGGDALPRMPRGVGFDEEPRHSESHSFRDVQVLLPPVPRLAPEVTKQFSSLMPAWRSKLNAEQERSSKRMLRHERGRLFRQMGEHDDRKHADLL